MTYLLWDLRWRLRKLHGFRANASSMCFSTRATCSSSLVDISTQGRGSANTVPSRGSSICPTFRLSCELGKVYLIYYCNVEGME